MFEDEKTNTATKNDHELDAIQYGLITGWVFVVSALIFAAILIIISPDSEGVSTLPSGTEFATSL